ncbi:MAG: hypothetical protein PHD76_10850 [Methylacidiphilales bacterium]|nr:hypothetical protein [Candidatus Methylacidiphilales bacterium]
MKKPALLIGILLICIGIAGVLRPMYIMTIGHHLLTPTRLHAVAALRIGIGLVLILAAPTSRAPNALRVLGALIFVVGVATAFMGVDRARVMLDWWSAQGPVFIRLPYCIAIAAGSFVTYAVTARQRSN